MTIQKARKEKQSNILPPTSGAMPAEPLNATSQESLLSAIYFHLAISQKHLDQAKSLVLTLKELMASQISSASRGKKR
jgi:hypothetical protein